MCIAERLPLSGTSMLFCRTTAKPLPSDSSGTGRGWTSGVSARNGLETNMPLCSKNSYTWGKLCETPSDMFTKSWRSEGLANEWSFRSQRGPTGLPIKSSGRFPELLGKAKNLCRADCFSRSFQMSGGSYFNVLIFRGHDIFDIFTLEQGRKSLKV